MSRKQKIKHMTPEELKSKLYAHFQRNGSLDHMRAQLRGQLVSELFKVAEPLGPDTFPNASDVGKCLLPLQVCNWLVYDHLFRQDYQYSLSTFVTEAQLPYPEKFLTAGDVLRLLGLSGTEFESICKLYSENNELGFLHSLLLAIIKALFNVPNKDSALNFGQNFSFEVNESSKKQILTNPEESSPSFVLNKSQALNDTSLANDSAISKKLSVDKGYIFNNTEKSLEISFHEQLQSVKEDNEREVLKLKHRLLEELESLHKQEHKRQLETEFTKAELKKEQNKFIKEKEQFKEKEVLLEKEMAHKYHIKMRDADEDFASKLHWKEKELETLKTKLSEREQKLMHVEAELAGEKDSQKILKRDLEDLNHMYRIIQDKYSAVLDENTNLLKKFESMSDYSILKEELSSKSREVLKLQHEIREIHQRSESERRKYVETVRSLEDTLSIKEPQLIQSQTELDQMKNTLEREEGFWNKERKKLEQELNEFKGLYKTVIQRMEGQEEDIQDLHKTIHTMNYKFTNNSVTKSGTVPYKAFHKNTEMSLQSKPETLFTKRTMFAQQNSEVYQNVPLQFLSDAKRRLCNLKNEEDKVQEKYSFIYSTIPENNKQTDTYFNFMSVPKSTIEDYSLTFPKSSSVSLTLDKWSRNKSTNSRSPYSLDDVKKLVTRSLFPYKTNFGTDVSDLNIPMQTQNLINRSKDYVNESQKYSELHKNSIINNSKSNSFTSDIGNRGNIPVTSDSVYEEQNKQTSLNCAQNEFMRRNIDCSKDVPDVYASAISKNVTPFHSEEPVPSSLITHGLQEAYSKSKDLEHDEQSLLNSVQNQSLFNPSQNEFARRNIDSSKDIQDVYVSAISKDATSFFSKEPVTSNSVPYPLQVHSTAKDPEQDEQTLNLVQVHTPHVSKDVEPLYLREPVTSSSVIYGSHENHSKAEGSEQDGQSLLNPVQNEFMMRNISSSKNVQEVHIPEILKDTTSLHSKESEEIAKTSSDIHQDSSYTSQRESANPVTDTFSQEMSGGILDKSKNESDTETTAIFVNLDEAWKQGSSLTVPTRTNIYKDSLKNASFLESNSVNSSKNQTIAELKDPVSQHGANLYVKIQSLQQNETPTVLSESNKTEIKNSAVKEPELEHQVNNDNLNIEEQKSAKSSEKVGSIDSASELSEIHLSCGSEAEPQKEDSDAW